MGATREAAVMTPTVVDPVIMFPRMPMTKGSRIAGSPDAAKASASTPTAGVALRMALREPPRPVTTRIMAEARSPSSIQTDRADFRSSGLRMFHQARTSPMDRAITGHPRYSRIRRAG